MRRSQWSALAERSGSSWLQSDRACKAEVDLRRRAGAPPARRPPSKRVPGAPAVERVSASA
eukprot:9940779-Alexandrium_andersonii.AAC.1